MGGGYSSHFADEETEASSGVTFPGQVIILNLHLPDSEATLHPGNIFEAFKPIVVCVCVRVYVRERETMRASAQRELDPAWVLGEARAIAPLIGVREERNSPRFCPGGWGDTTDAFQEGP